MIKNLASFIQVVSSYCRYVLQNDAFITIQQPGGGDVHALVSGIARVLAACGCCHHRAAASAAISATGDLLGSATAGLPATLEAGGAEGSSRTILAQSVLHSGQIICAGVIGKATINQLVCV